ncbi:DUF624 domain-containing protein [Microbacterium sp. A82]|uniref:DUF624 domain-containing protein n=1 Tax=Microbacterium sp. A82 TaxID=3450452 RepID=UPI003F2F2936
MPELLFEPAPPRQPIAGAREFGQGPLGRASTVIYWYMMIGLLMALTQLPTLVAVMLLDRSASNIPLYAAAMIPLAPAFAAGTSALSRRVHDDDATPWRAYWRGFGSNLVDVLRLWLPLLLLGALIAMALANSEAAGISTGYALVLIVIFATLTVIAVHAMAISTFFAFRFVDALRLGVVFLARRPLSSLGVLSLLVLAAAAVIFSSELVVTLLSVVWAALLLRNERPVLRGVADQFIVPNPEESRLEAQRE